MRIYFDTEFTDFRDGLLLSAGFVTDDDRSFYVEIDEPRRRKAASDFCQRNVLTQFGLYEGTTVATDAEAGTRIADWLVGLGPKVILSYDYKLDWRFVEHVLRTSGRWEALASRVQAHDIASDASHEAAIAAQESYFKRLTVGPGRHHALVDALALRERWREHLRLFGESNAA